MGEELSATVVPGGATVTYEWQRADEAEGVYTPISLANAQTYTLTLEDENKYIKVKAVGTGNYTGNVTSSATNQITSL